MPAFDPSIILTTQQHWVIIGFLKDISGKIGNNIDNAAISGDYGSGGVRNMFKFVRINNNANGFRHCLEGFIHVNGDPIRIIVRNTLAGMLSARNVVIQEPVIFVEEEISGMSTIGNVNVQVETDAFSLASVP